MRSSDFVSVHLPLTNETHQLLNADRIASMKSGAVLVNTARGGIVDEIALADSLSSGHLWGAAIDVFEQEPIDMENPLLFLPNVVVAPHIGSATIKTRAKMADLAADNALATIKGQHMPFCANPEVYS